MANRVFVPQWPMKQDDKGQRLRVDLSPAREYGDIVEICTFEEAGSASLDAARDMMLERLKDFDDEDVMLPIGNPMLMVLAATIALEYNDGRARFIQWDRVRRAYREWQLDQTFWDHVNGYVDESKDGDLLESGDHDDDDEG